MFVVPLKKNILVGPLLCARQQESYAVLSTSLKLHMNSTQCRSSLLLEGKGWFLSKARHLGFYRVYVNAWTQKKKNGGRSKHYDMVKHGKHCWFDTGLT